MIEHVKPVESLSVADLKAAPVWQYANRDGAGETVVRALKKLPVRFLTGSFFSARTTVSPAPSRFAYCQTGAAFRSATLNDSTGFTCSIMAQEIRYEATRRIAACRTSHRMPWYTHQDLEAPAALPPD